MMCCVCQKFGIEVQQLTKRARRALSGCYYGAIRDSAFILSARLPIAVAAPWSVASCAAGSAGGGSRRRPARPSACRAALPRRRRRSRTAAADAARGGGIAPARRGRATTRRRRRAPRREATATGTRTRAASASRARRPASPARGRRRPRAPSPGPGGRRRIPVEPPTELPTGTTRAHLPCTQPRPRTRPSRTRPRPRTPPPWAQLRPRPCPPWTQSRPRPRPPWMPPRPRLCLPWIGLSIDLGGPPRTGGIAVLPAGDARTPLLRRVRASCRECRRRRCRARAATRATTPTSRVGTPPPQRRRREGRAPSPKWVLRRPRRRQKRGVRPTSAVCGIPLGHRPQQLPPGRR